MSALEGKTGHADDARRGLSLTDAVEKGFGGGTLSNIDSRRASNAQDRFKKLATMIRLLRILILQIFRGDFFNSIDPKRR
jgi:hypothetical protein